MRRDARNVRFVSGNLVIAHHFFFFPARDTFSMPRYGALLLHVKSNSCLKPAWPDASYYVGRRQLRISNVRSKTVR